MTAITDGFDRFMADGDAKPSTPNYAARHGDYRGGYRTQATLRRLQDEADGLLDAVAGAARQARLLWLEGWLSDHALKDLEVSS